MEEALTFSDVLLVPQRSAISSRKHVDTTGLFSRNIPVKVPIISANMDTVTEAAMAIAMAQCGGLGVIHRFLKIPEQASQVQKVKRAESILIDEPYTLSPTDTIAEARSLMRRWQVRGLLVVDGKKRLVGVATERDLRFKRDDSLTIGKAMTRKLITADPGVSLQEAEKIFDRYKIEKLPLVDKNGILRGLITAKDLMKKLHHPDASKDKKGRLLVGAAVGVVGDYLERAAALLEAQADVLVVDVAHGHAEHVLEAVKTIKKQWPKAEVVAGNVATSQGVRDLALAGADGIKVGVGPGATCSTRIVTGCGVPQFSAIQDCARAAKEIGIPVIADGGIRDSGDITKALAAGASSVMIGSLLAGTDESPGWTLVRGGMKFKTYRGMASLSATISKKRKETEDAEDIQEQDVSEIVPEGVETTVPYRGSSAEIVNQLAGGLRSGMSYCGAKDLSTLWKKARFVRITSAGWQESKPHALEK